MEKSLLLRTEDLLRRCMDKNIITYTNFLTPAEQTEIMLCKWFNTNKALLIGGVKEAERKRLFFLPDYISEENFDINEYIIALKISFSFADLTHRDFLGALLNLGIKRECIGDIYIHEKEAYVIAVKEIGEYIIGNLTKVGKVGVKIEKSDLPEIRVKIPDLKEKEFTVKSLRADSVSAGTFNLSREEIVRNIKLGSLCVNYLICEDADKEIKEGDIISLKHFGKAKVLEISGMSRKERIFIKVGKYI